MSPNCMHVPDVKYEKHTSSEVQVPVAVFLPIQRKHWLLDPITSQVLNYFDTNYESTSHNTVNV